MRLLARYASIDELTSDVGDQLPRGGMVVRTTVPTGLQLFSRVEVAVECGESAVVVAGQVLQIFPGIGVAVGLDRPARDRIEGLAGGTRAGLTPVTVPGEPGVDAGAAGHADAPFPEPPPPSTRTRSTDLDVELSARLARGTTKPTLSPPMTTTMPSTASMTSPAAPGLDDPPEPRRPVATGSSASIDRIQVALRGDRDARFEIMRGKNRTLHAYVLRNPAVTVDEIALFAKMTTIAPDVLTQIADRASWGHRPEIAAALVRNIALPVPVAVRLLDHVSEADLRQLAKDARTREPVQRAARKKLLS